MYALKRYDVALVFKMQVGGMAWVAGIECDVSSPASVQRLMSAATSQMGSVDVWINNAGNSGSFQVLLTFSAMYIICRRCVLNSDLSFGLPTGYAFAVR